MTIQQMMLGASIEFSASITAINVESTQGPSSPPPPTTMEIHGTSTATAIGGSGSYTYSWSITSGTARLSGSTTGPTFSINDVVQANSTSSGGIRCVISDGSQTITLNDTYNLRYTRLV